jgi:hypothetical protein
MNEDQLRRQAYFRLIVFTLILIVIGIYASSIGVMVGGEM